MGKSKGSTTQTVALDPTTQQYANDVWHAASTAANSGGTPVNQLTRDAASGFGSMANAGNLGFGALSGDPAAVSKLMSPYTQNVIDQLNQQYAKMRAGTMNDVNAQATAAGAFGGSRHGVAEGVALGNLGLGQGQQIAGLLDTGFNNAMGRAGTLANLGFSANGALASLGDYMRGVDVENDPSMRNFQFKLNALNGMPHGSVQTGTQTNGHNGATGFLGGAATGAGVGEMFGPVGGLVGAGLGGLLGLF